MPLTPISTRILILCILVTGIGHFQGMIDTFTLNPRDLMLHNWQGLITGALLSPFAHAGIWHLLSNILWLVFLGPQIEEKLGVYRYTLFFFFALVVTELGILAFSHAPVLGMSGFTMALFGYMVAEALHTKRSDAKGGVVMLGLFLLLGGSNVSVVAHISGALAGIVFYQIKRLRWLK